jgi:adenosine deaminase
MQNTTSRSAFRFRRRAAFAFLPLFCLFIQSARAQSSPKSTAKPVASPAAARRASHADDLAERNLEVARANPLSLRAFLIKMPKGADLHNHLSGAVYAESWIRAGAEDGLCVDLAKHSFVRAPAATQSSSSQPACAEGQVPAAQAFKDQHLYDDLINAFSMRSFVPSSGISAHDHFFDAFAKFGGTNPRHAGEWIDEVATRAAAQNEQYLELMETPDFTRTAILAHQLGWQDDFAQFRDALLAHGLRDDIAGARAHLDEADALRFQREHCGLGDATPACNVQIRYLYQILRGFPKEQVFAQSLLGFEVASADPRVVGINMVMPEDGYISMTDYALHMRIIAFLHGLYPKVHISLHAGEIAPGFVTYEGLCCHIRLAVEEAHAERIGHGVDVMYENHPHELLKEMAAKHVMVEINLTSNDGILGVSGKEHPFPIYRQFRVPVALSSDDEGVSRIDLTHEYVRAVETYGLHYADLKQMVRTGLEHGFLPGASLWREPDAFSHPVAACAHDVLGGEKPSASCEDFLKSSGKAQEQWELERRFREFESSL